MYRYETHLHTAPVSCCALIGVEENLDFYKQLGYDGVFITNHFIDGNIRIDHRRPYAEKIEFYFSDYEKGLAYGKQIGLKVFCGIELTCGGTDFLVYGLDKQWFLKHPDVMDLKKSEQLAVMKENGALIIQAHPFREASYIDHIRLFPRHVHGVEVVNACRKDAENAIAKYYAAHYGLREFAGSDNHAAAAQPQLAGMCTDTPVSDERDFIDRVLNGTARIFTQANESAETK